MPTSFLVKTDKNSEEIVSFLKDFLEEKDMIFVNKVDKEDLASNKTYLFYLSFKLNKKPR